MVNYRTQASLSEEIKLDSACVARFFCDSRSSDPLLYRTNTRWN